MSIQPATTQLQVDVPEDVLMLIFETLISDADPEDVCKHVERWLLGCGAGSRWCRPGGVGSEVQWERIVKPLMYLVPRAVVFGDVAGWEPSTWRQAFIEVSTALFHWRDNRCHHHLLWYKRTLECQNAFTGEERVRYEPWLRRCVFEWRERFFNRYAQPVSTFSAHLMPTFQLTTSKLLYRKTHYNTERSLHDFHGTECVFKTAGRYKDQDKVLAEGIMSSVHDIVERALRNGANPNEIPCALELVIHNRLIWGADATRVLDTLLAWPGTDVNMRNRPTTALHVAVAMDMKSFGPNVVRSLLNKLLDAGADVHERDCLHRTPLLHLASENCRWSECVGCLVVRGADVNARDSSFNTPLLLALNRRNLRVADALLDLGADVRVYNRKLETPHDIANKCLSAHPNDPRWLELVGRLDELYAAQGA